MPSACCSIVAIVLPSGCSQRRSKHGRELAVDLGARRVGDRPLAGIVLEVDRALREAVEPAPQRVAVEVAEAEDAAEGAHRDRLEVLAHQLGLAAPGERVEQLLDERLDEPRVRRLDDARAERRVEHRRSCFCGSPSSTRMLLPPIARSSGDGVTDESISSGMRGRELDVGPAGHEPEADRGTKQTGASRRIRA